MLVTLFKSFLRGIRGDSQAATDVQILESRQSVGERLKNAAKLHGDGDLAGARVLYEEVLKAQPENVDAHHLLGLLDLYCGNHQSAEASIRRAIELDPRNASFLEHLGLVLEYQGNLSEAITCCARVLTLNPDDAEAHCRMGSVLLTARRMREAAASYRRAIDLEPDSAKFKFNLSMVLLLEGELEEGWQKYEFRWDGSSEAAGRKREFTQPQWRGEPLGRRTILLHAEQAFGDTLQFVRYAGLVVDRGDAGHVILECQPELRRLCETIKGEIEVIDRGEPLPHFDVHCPLLSLPLAFGTTLSSIPDDVPYLRPDPVEAGKWGQRLRGLGSEFRVGLVWSGKVRRMNRWHNLELAELAPLLEFPAVRYFSLQKARSGSAVKSECREIPFDDFTGELNDFADTAALVSNLDLVISVDTSVAHLCGALGMPVWLLARYDADWRWLLDRSDSPWYPSMTIFRQSAPGNWGELILQVASALHTEMNGRNSTGAARDR